jgi:hypothetical protein
VHTDLNQFRNVIPAQSSLVALSVVIVLAATLIICGLGRMNPLIFAAIAAIATLPLAARSWAVVKSPRSLSNVISSGGTPPRPKKRQPDSQGQVGAPLTVSSRRPATS